MERKTTQPVSSTLRRALRILEFVSENQPTTASEIQDALGMTKGSVYHVLASLEAFDYVRKDGRSYSLTFKLYAMGQTVPMALDFIEIARPFMKELATREKLNVYLAVPDGSKMVGVSQVKPPGPIQVADDFALSYECHCTASGKLWLSILPRERRALLYRQMELEKITDNTITDAVLLEREIERIIERGYSQEVMEHSPLINGVAAPIFDHRDVFVASLSAIGPTPVLASDQIARVGAIVTRTAGEISGRLGNASASRLRDGGETLRRRTP